MSETKPLIIDLDESQTSHLFKKDEQFFRDEIAHAFHTIHVLANDEKSNIRPPISIFGRRGAGKTSFLHGLEHEVQHNTRTDLKKICTLEILEPNRIEKNEIFVVTAITLIMRKVREQELLRRNNRDSSSVSESLQKLASTFNVLLPDDEVSRRGSNESAIGFAERVLADSESGLSVRARLEEFVKNAADFCECDSFLLMIDDTDVTFHRCGDILEAVRKYLSIKGLIVVLAADEELLDIQLTRVSSRWMSDLLDTETMLHPNKDSEFYKRFNRYRTEAYALKEQYFSKTLPKHYRILLPPLSRKIRQEKEPYVIKNIWLQKIEKEKSTKPTKSLKECLSNFGKYLGGNEDVALSFLPDSSRSLLRFLLELFDFSSENKQDNFLSYLDQLFRPARRDVDMRGWTLRRLRQGDGDLILLKWVIERTQEHPRSFALVRDTSVNGDDRCIVPALIHASWVYGCHQNHRTDGFLSYGLRIVLPACCVERSRNRRATAEELLFYLKPMEEYQTHCDIVGRLLAWYADLDDRETRIGPRSHWTSTGVHSLGDKTIGTIGKDESNKVWYEQIEGRPLSFFMGLARIADILNIHKPRLDRDGVDNTDDSSKPKYVILDLNDVRNTIRQIDKRANIDLWYNWISLYHELSKKVIEDSIIPTRIIGEIFAFMFNQWREGVVGSNHQDASNYVYAFWFSLISWELDLRSGKKSTVHFKRKYTKISNTDVMDILNHSQEAFVHLYYSQLWLQCPLFNAQLNNIKNCSRSGESDLPGRRENPSTISYVAKFYPNLAAFYEGIKFVPEEK